MEGARSLRRAALALPFALLAAGASSAPAAQIKVIADQDSAGPQGTNFLSLLMLLAAPQLDVLGITTVSGDQWMEPATVFALHAVELTGRTDVPVVKGAQHPLLNTRREQELREALYGSHPTWHGAFNPDAPPPELAMRRISASLVNGCAPASPGVTTISRQGSRITIAAASGSHHQFSSNPPLLLAPMT